MADLVDKEPGDRASRERGDALTTSLLPRLEMPLARIFREQATPNP
jgi:hypothetical protein